MTTIFERFDKQFSVWGIEKQTIKTSEIKAFLRSELEELKKECVGEKAKKDFDYYNQHTSRFCKDRDTWGEDVAKINNEKVTAYNDHRREVLEAFERRGI